MLITLFTDAGFCPHTGIGTYAVWAKESGKTLRKSGVLRGTMEVSAIAELRALANGIALVLSIIRPSPGSKIIAQLDCQDAINAMLGTGYKKPRQQERVRSAVEDARRRLIEAKVSIEYRRVPGHAGRGTPRTAVNTWCDSECRRHLREARAAKAQKELVI